MLSPLSACIAARAGAAAHAAFSPRTTPLFVLQESILNAVQIREEGREKAKNEDAAQDILIDGKKHLLVAITTDRGLCGAVNSSLSRSVRKEVNAAAKAGAPVKIFVLGDKGRAQIAREYLPVMTKAIDTYLGASCVGVRGVALPAPRRIISGLRWYSLAVSFFAPGLSVVTFSCPLGLPADQGITFALASSSASQICAQDYEVLTLCFNHYENQVRAGGCSSCCCPRAPSSPYFVFAAAAPCMTAGRPAFLTAQVRFTLTYKKLPQFLGLPVGVLPSQLKGFEVRTVWLIYVSLSIVSSSE